MEARLFHIRKMEEGGDRATIQQLVGTKGTRDFYLELVFPSKASAREVYTRKSEEFSYWLERKIEEFLDKSFEYSRTFMEHDRRMTLNVTDLSRALQFIFKQEHLIVHFDKGGEDRSWSSGNDSMAEGDDSWSSDSGMMEDTEAPTFTCSACSFNYDLEILGNRMEVLSGATEEHICHDCAQECCVCGLHCDRDSMVKCSDFLLESSCDYDNYVCSVDCKREKILEDGEEDVQYNDRLATEETEDDGGNDMVAMRLSEFVPESYRSRALGEISRNDGITASALARQFVELARGRNDVTPFDPDILFRFYSLLKFACDCFISNELLKHFLQDD